MPYVFVIMKEVMSQTKQIELTERTILPRVQVPDEVLNMKIEDCEFSVRIVGCLRQSEIKTVRELIVYSVDNIKRIPNLGKKSLREIINFMDEKGLTFTDKLPNILLEKTRLGMNLPLSVFGDTSRQIIELWIKLEEPYLNKHETSIIKAKCFLENIKRQKAEMNPKFFDQPRVKSS